MLKNAADVLHREERLALRSGRDSLLYTLNVDGENILCWGSQGGHVVDWAKPVYHLNKYREDCCWSDESTAVQKFDV